ncbi:MAG: phage tail sheath subtilisin-like domain-containing protein, partial [Tannerellaceae bacterium]
MGEYKTPGVYIKEKNAFGNSVVEAETAIPAFIGYTESAQNGDDDLTNKPMKISSMTEFMKYFGGAPMLDIKIDLQTYYAGFTADDLKNLTEEAAKLVIAPPANVLQEKIVEEKEETFTFKTGNQPPEKTFTKRTSLFVMGASPYTLYHHMMLFFANGGSTCYVVSAGKYEKTQTIDSSTLISALHTLELVREITMVAIPEAVNIADVTAFNKVLTAMLQHCGDTMKNRFALLDIYPKESERTSIDTQINDFQEGVGSNFLSYGAAYYPWLNTSVVTERDLDGKMFEWKVNIFIYSDKLARIDKNLSTILLFFSTSEITVDKPEKEEEDEGKTMKGHTFKFKDVAEGDIYADNDKKMKEKIGKVIAVEELKKTEGSSERIVGKSIQIEWYVLNDEEKQTLHQALLSGSPLYKQAIKSLLAKLNLLPPSAAIAGIYTMVDRNRGVWKAPANVTLNYVNSPAEDIDDDQQAGLNAPMNGKAINVIRTFRGEGVKVWGARTLDGNSLDWRYINVRRTLLFLEESVKNAARAYVFEPNDAGTWINMKCMIENFLRSVWKRGG